MSYGKRLFIACDQLLNVVFGGWPDETLSSRAYRLACSGTVLPMKLINAVFFWESEHCKASYESERSNAQYPQDFRQ